VTGEALTARSILAAALLFLVGCSRGSDPEPRWIHLAAAQGAREQLEASGVDTASGIRLVPEADALWMEADVERAAWSPKSRGTWKTRFPVLTDGILTPDSVALTSDEREFHAFRRGGINDENPPGTYGVAGGLILLRLAQDEEPPAHAHIRVRVAHRGGDDVAGRRFSGEGLTVWAGERLVIASEIPPSSVLRVATLVEPVLTRNPGPSRFHIELDGEVLLDHEQEAPRHGSAAWHELVLPAAGRASGRLTFEVTGPPAKTAFLAPIVGPRVPQRARERDQRPDLVLFVADTFRADNLACYGGLEGLTPELDRLASESLTFLQARSTSTYTLPAHAALFSSLYPHQTSADGLAHALPDAIDTIAERLRRSGYRTGAVTDAAVVSRAFGMQQGFESWDERRSDLDSTLERVRAFLGSADGRPTFLFVHTYRVHSDYRVTPATRERLARELGIDITGDWDSCYGPFEAIGRRDGTPAEARPFLPPLRDLYHGGVADLDLWFGHFREDPLVAPLLERGFLVFTSDHGEAFLEHDNLLHGGEVWDELIRVPLLVRGPGLTPRHVDQPVSHVDVLPTLAQLAGLPTESLWQGTSLLALPARDRPIFSFSCSGTETTAAILDGRRKLIARADTERGVFVEPFRAFDLASDAAEGVDLASGDGAWPAELFRSLTRRSELLEPLEAAVPAALDEGQSEDLRELGYAGDE